MVFAEITGWYSVEAPIFFRLLSNCLNWKIYCMGKSIFSYKRERPIVDSWGFHVEKISVWRYFKAECPCQGGEQVMNAAKMLIFSRVFFE